MIRKIVILGISLLAISLQITMAANVRYVSAAGAGTKTGESWGNALPGDSIQYAINSLAITGGGQVWIAAGTYYPNKDSVGKKTFIPYNCTFSLRANVALYGGFAGTEVSVNDRAKGYKDVERTAKAWEFTNETILSGDIDRDGTLKNNAFHVVTDLLPDQKNVIIDGVTISNGAAADFLHQKYYHVLGGGVIAKNAQISRCIISKNFALLSGGGIAITNQAIIDSCFITRDSCLGYGGGVSIIEQGTMKNSEIFSNFGGKAGGVVLNAGGNVYTSSIYNNLSDSVGGVFMNNGGALVGSLVYNNQAISSGAGGIGGRNGTILSTTTAHNVDKNLYGVTGSGFIINCLLNDYFKPNLLAPNVIKYSAISDSLNKTVLNDSTNQFLYIDPNLDFYIPNFNFQTNFRGIAHTPDQYAQYARQNWTLYSGSRFINLGSPDISLYNLPQKDIFGKDRLKYDRIDIGANEFESRLFVSVTGAGKKNGSSWSDAIAFEDIYKSFVNQSGEIWLAAGNYETTNSIIVNDGLMLYGGFEGNESSINDRKRADMDGNGKIEPWEFVNESIIINKTTPKFDSTGKMTHVFFVFAGKRSIIDGFTVTSTDNIVRGGTLYLYNGKVLNSKFINNNNGARLYNIDIHNSLMENCYVAQNTSAYIGGGVSLFSKGVVRGCLIRQNKSEFYGGGAYIYDGTLDRCVVVQNSIAGNVNVNGGGVNIESGLIDNCLIANNSAKGLSTRGGGIYVYANDSTVRVRNSTIVHNTVEGVESTAPDMAIKCAVTMTNCIVGSPLYVQSLNLRNNISYSAIVGGFSDLGAGKNILNIASQAELDKQFVAPSSNLGRDEEKYTANWQLGAGSKFINRGNVFIKGSDSSLFDLQHSPRILHDTLDLGAYEYLIAQPKSAVVALTKADQLNKDSVQFSWNAQAVDHYSLWVREGLSGAVVPQNGLTYFANQKLGSGATIDGWFCVYDGKNTKASVTGLMQGSSYNVMLIPSNGLGYRVYGTRVVEDDNILFFTTKREQSIQLNMPDTVQATSSIITNLNSTSGLAVKLSSASEKDSSISIVGTAITAHKVDTAIVTAYQAGNAQYFPATLVDTLFVKKASQSISFDKMKSKTFGNDDFRPTVFASSLLPIHLISKDTAIAEIVNEAIRIKKTGTVRIVAEQKGNAIYDSARSVTQTLQINKASQYVLFGDISDKIYGNEDFTPFVKASSGMDVVLKPNNDTVVKIINNTTLRIIGTGTVTITASQTGNSLFEPAASVSKTFKVVKASQYITFNAIANKVFGENDFTPIVASSSHLPVLLTSNNTDVASIVDNKIVINGVGDVTITASQAGNKNYDAATSVAQSFKVAALEQSITVTKYISKSFNDSDFVLDGFSSAALPLTYSTTSSIITISNNTVHITGCGTANIAVEQAGNQNILPAHETIVLNVTAQAQAISFAPLDALSYRDTSFAAKAKASSGLKVRLITSDNAVARIENDSIIHVVGAGEAIITAQQFGNDTVLAATPVSQILKVSKVLQTLVFANKIKQLVYGAKDTLLVVKSSIDNLPVRIESANNAIVEVDGFVLRAKGVGKVAIKVSQAGTAGIVAVSQTDTVEVVRANQTIQDFDASIHALVGTEAYPLNASSSTGFAVKYEVLNPSVANKVGNKLKFLAPGVCKLRAYVSQSANYNEVSDTCIVTVSALNVLETPNYKFWSDTVIDLNSLRLNTDEFTFNIASTANNKVTIDGSKATIVPNRSKACWTGVDMLLCKAQSKTTASDTISFAIKVTRTRHIDEIGMVSTDSVTGSYNVIAWVPKKHAATDKWIVYRRSQSLSQWDVVDSVSATDTSVVVDKKVNTQQQAYQYVLVTKDEFGCASPHSLPHTTMHLKTGVSLQNLPQLWWTAYEGIPVDAYIVYRQNPQTKLYDSIGSTFLTSFTDLHPNGTTNYRVAIRFAKLISPIKLKTDTGPFSQSLSNMSEAALVDITLLDTLSEPVAYPNPSNNEVSILGANIDAVQTLQLTNSKGSTEHVAVLRKSATEINFSVKGLSAGLYSVQVPTAAGLKTVKLMVE